MLQIHQNIKDKLNNFIERNCVPHIIFHGPCGSGKKTMVRDFLMNVYKTDENLKKYTMFVDCAHGKGIKFVRDDIKFFAKTNITNVSMFKSIVFLNTDKLTMDAQSALRRCIELFSHSTRFFILLEDKYKLLKPICSRFCEFYVGLPVINNVPVNLYSHNNKSIWNNKDEKKRTEYVVKTFSAISKNIENTNYIDITNKLYDKGISSIDIINTIKTTTIIDEKERYRVLFLINNARREFRNEKTFIMFIFSILFLRNNRCLENITFM